MNVVRILYDAMTEEVRIGITRDFLLLAGSFKNLAYLDPDGQMDQALMEKLGIDVAPSDAVPVLNILYKTNVWLRVDPSIRTVKRDLAPKNLNQKIYEQPNNPGYVLKPQGRPGANMTELYLNRPYPKGTGVKDPLVLLLWT